MFNIKMFDDTFGNLHEMKMQAAQEFGVNEPYWSWLEDMYVVCLHPQYKTPEHYELYSAIKERYYTLSTNV